jgi:hypothetical protein
MKCVKKNQLHPISQSTSSNISTASTSRITLPLTTSHCFTSSCDNSHRQSNNITGSISMMSRVTSSSKEEWMNASHHHKASPTTIPTTLTSRVTSSSKEEWMNATHHHKASPTTKPFIILISLNWHARK